MGCCLHINEDAGGDTPAAGALAYQIDMVGSASTTSTAYVTFTTLAGSSKVLSGEEWKINMCLFICHPINVFTVNTFVEWQIETSTNVFQQFDEWQVNWPITIQVGETSDPAHRTKNLLAGMDQPRMRVRFKMSAAQASATFVEDARWGGVRIEPAP